MSGKKFESPKQAAAALIELNKTLRQKLSQAQRMLQEREQRIAQIESASESSEEVTRLREQVDSLMMELSEVDKLRADLEQAVVERDSFAEQLQKAKRIANPDPDLLKQLMLSSMHIAGLQAELAAFRKHHPDSPLLQPSGDTYTDGREKTKGRMEYESAFDIKGHELGIEKPKTFRP